MVKTKIKTRAKKRYRINPALVFGIALLVVMVSAIAFIRLIPANQRCEGIPVYSAQSVYGCINPNLTRNLIDALSMYLDLNASKWIVMFGATYCPHCKEMHRFFEEHHPEIYRVLWVDVDPEAGGVFSTLALIEKKSGVKDDIVGGVPQTLVIVNGTIRAVVIGKEVDRGFWDRLIGVDRHDQ